MRSRNLKPGFFDNETLAELSFEYRLLFQGLWGLADREGRLEDRPKKIKAQVFPYDDVDVNYGLDALQQKGFVVRYESENIKCIQVLNFKKHQNPHVKEAASSLPAPDKKIKAPEIPVLAPENKIQASEIPAPAVLIPSSLIPDSLDKSSCSASRTKSRFPEFWTEYPKKTGKADAAKKWASKKCDAVADDILKNLRERKRDDPNWRGDGDMQFVLHPKTYLHGERWNDAPVVPNSRGSPQTPSKTALAIANLEADKRGQRSLDAIDSIRFSALAEPFARESASPRHDSGDGGGMAAIPWVSGGFG